MKRLREGRKADLNWLEIWILFVLSTAGGWIGIEKIMAIIFLLERVYGLSKACFVPGRIPWSHDVVDALARLTSLGLVEVDDRAYRITENGRMAIERYSTGDPRIRYPLVAVKFFIEWNVDTLAEYIRVNYPEWTTPFS